VNVNVALDFWSVLCRRMIRGGRQKNERISSIFLHTLKVYQDSTPRRRKVVPTRSGFHISVVLTVSYLEQQRTAVQ
jgi:hypothetical protein